MINLSDQMLYRLGNLNQEYKRVSYQMSSGKILDRGSDDSVLFSKELHINDRVRTFNGLKTQIEKTTAYNNVSDSSIGEIKKSIEHIQVETLKALNAGMDVSDKKAVATNLVGVRENMLMFLNETVDGEYLYSGSDTTIPPFRKLEGFDDFGHENYGKIVYDGDAILRKIAVAPNNYRERGVTGFDIMFYNTDTAIKGDTLVFNPTDRIIDNSGLEWTKQLNFKPTDNAHIIDENDKRWVPTITFQESDILIDENGLEWRLSGTGATATLEQIGVDGITPTGESFTITNFSDNTYTIDISGFVNDPITPINNATGSNMWSIQKSNGTLESAMQLKQVDSDDGGITYNFTNLKSLEIKEYSTIGSDLIPSYVVISDSKDVNHFRRDNVIPPVEPISVTYLRQIDINGDFTEKRLEVSSYDDEENKLITTQVGENGLLLESKRNFFDDLNQLINALNGYKEDGITSVGEDYIEQNDAIREKLDSIKAVYDSSNVAHAKIGARNKIFETSLEYINVQITHYNILYQETSGADLAKLAMESKALEMTYSALYTTISKMNDLSLIKFIR